MLRTTLCTALAALAFTVAADNSGSGSGSGPGTLTPTSEPTSTQYVAVMEPTVAEHDGGLSLAVPVGGDIGFMIGDAHTSLHQMKCKLDAMSNTLLSVGHDGDITADKPVLDAMKDQHADNVAAGTAISAGITELRGITNSTGTAVIDHASGWSEGLDETSNALDEIITGGKPTPPPTPAPTGKPEALKVPVMIKNTAEYGAWAAWNNLNTEYSIYCTECSYQGKTFPYYMCLDNSHGHGTTNVNALNTLNTYLQWRSKGQCQKLTKMPTSRSKPADRRGRALFVHKGGKRIRGESGRNVNGWEWVVVPAGTCPSCTATGSC